MTENDKPAPRTVTAEEVAAALSTWDGDAVVTKNHAASLVAHLVATLPPAPRTVTEWGVRSSWVGLDVLPCADEEAARRAKGIRYDEPGATVIRREVTEWVEVTEP